MTKSLDVSKFPIDSKEEFDATQIACDSNREKIISEQVPIVKDNFLYVEEVVKELKKRNVPFMLLVSPVGFDSLEEKKFWQHHHITSTLDAFAPESKEKLNRYIWNLVATLLKAASLFSRLAIVSITENGKGHKFQNGKEIKNDERI